MSWAASMRPTSSSRRSDVRLARLMVVIAVAATACTADRPSGSPQRPEPTPFEGGRIRFGVLGEPATLDPQSSKASFLTHMLVAPRSLGAFRIARRVPGLKIEYEAVSSSQLKPNLEGLAVFFVASIDILFELLERGKLDAALIPSTVNLEERFESKEVEIEGELGWESIELDLGGIADGSTREAVAGAIGRAVLEEGLIRDDGRITDTLTPGPSSRQAEGPFRKPSRRPGGGVRLALAAPEEDELLLLLQRALHDQLEAAGFVVDVVTIDSRTYYGEWDDTDPVEVALRRRFGGPGLPERNPELKRLEAVPLFQVESFVAWGPRVLGLEVNPTRRGPLLNAHKWSVTGE
jgi:hypothetical protein